MNKEKQEEIPPKKEEKPEKKKFKFIDLLPPPPNIPKFNTNTIIILLLFYMAFSPMLSASLNPNLEFEKIHEGVLYMVEGEYRQGAYSNSYRSGDSIKFMDGTIVPHAKLDKEITKFEPNTVIVCGKYIRNGGIPVLNVPGSANSNPPFNVVYCTEHKNIKTTYNGEVNIIMLGIAFGFYWYTRRRRFF